MKKKKFMKVDENAVEAEVFLMLPNGDQRLLLSQLLWNRWFMQKNHNRGKKRSWALRKRCGEETRKIWSAITLSAINKLNIPRAQNSLMNFDSSHLGFKMSCVQENKQIIAIAEISITFLSPKSGAKHNKADLKCSKIISLSQVQMRDKRSVPDH